MFNGKVSFSCLNLDLPLVFVYGNRCKESLLRYEETHYHCDTFIELVDPMVFEVKVQAGHGRCKYWGLWDI